MKQGKVLFLCTGNYYRSRFAEMLFNQLAEQAGLNWVADSKALDIKRGRRCNIGPISQHAEAGLAERGITLPDNPRFPCQVCEEDLHSSDLIIAVKEAEHRAMLKSLHPAWAERTEYWNIHDLDLSTPQDALAEIDRLVRALVKRLGETSGGNRALRQRQPRAGGI